YPRLEARGLIAPTFQYWDRQTDEMFAEFDNAVLKEDTRCLYVLQCERTKLIDEGKKLLEQYPACTIRMGTTFQSFTQDADGLTDIVVNDTAQPEELRR